MPTSPSPNNDNKTNENWAAGAPSYAKAVERLTTPPARSLLNRVATLLPLSTPNTSAFDNGAGTGVLSAVIKQQYPHVPLLATDASDGMIEVLSRRIEEAAWEDVEARVVDARFLDGIGDGRFSHTFSTFMLCLAPEPEKIVEEMRRVTRGDGVLGLAVWGDPKFGAFVKPWEMACRQVGRADWTYPQLMDEDWTIEANVKRGLEGAGWKDVSVWEEECVWGWGSGEEVAGYFFEGGNPANERAVEAFRVTGGDVGEARKVFERVLGEEGGKESGEIELRVVATLATARK